MDNYGFSEHSLGYLTSRLSGLRARLSENSTKAHALVIEREAIVDELAALKRHIIGRTR